MKILLALIEVGNEIRTTADKKDSKDGDTKGNKNGKKHTKTQGEQDNTTEPFHGCILTTFAHRNTTAESLTICVCKGVTFVPSQTETQGLCNHYLVFFCVLGYDLMDVDGSPWFSRGWQAMEEQRRYVP